MKIVKDLLVALLNATVMLLVALTLLVIMLVDRVEDLRNGIVQEVISNIAPQGERLERIGDQLEQINIQLQTADGEKIDALKNEVVALRAQLPDFSRLENIGSGEIAKQVVVGITQQLFDKPE